MLYNWVGREGIGYESKLLQCTIALLQRSYARMKLRVFVKDE